MQSLYCPECQEYLETSSGEMANCSCGWTQPEEENQSELNEFYLDWLEDMGYTHSEDLLEEWFESHCQFCGCNTEFEPCTCDHYLRY